MRCFNLLAVPVLLVLLPQSCGSGRSPQPDDQIATVAQNALPKEVLIETVRRFYSDALGIVPLEITPYDTSASSGLFRVREEDGLSESLLFVLLETGMVTSYSNHALQGQDEDGVIREYYPLEYAEWLEYKKDRHGEMPQVHARAAKLKITLRRGMLQETKEQRAEAEERTRQEQKWAELRQWKPEYQRFSQEAALEHLKPAIEYFRQPGDTYRCSFESSGLADVWAWHVTALWEYEGTPYRDKRLQMEISRYSGRIRNLEYTPVIGVPKQVTEPISKADALGTAKRFVRKSGLFSWSLFSRQEKIKISYDVGMEDITKIIALPKATSRGMSKKEIAAIKALSPTEPRYCWRVPFTYRLIRSRNINLSEGEKVEAMFSIFVDMETGNVICSGRRGLQTRLSIRTCTVA